MGTSSSGWASAAAGFVHNGGWAGTGSYRILGVSQLRRRILLQNSAARGSPYTSFLSVALVVEADAVDWYAGVGDRGQKLRPRRGNRGQP